MKKQAIANLLFHLGVDWFGVARTLHISPLLACQLYRQYHNIPGDSSLRTMYNKTASRARRSARHRAVPGTLPHRTRYTFPK